MYNGNNLPKEKVDLARIAKIAESLRKLIEEVKEIFPGRDGLINQIMYAILIRHHVLMYGVFGTGKTDLVNTIFKQITNARKISFALNKFSTPAELFGMPNMTVLQTTGQLEVDTKGPETIFQAHFMELDEFFDANGQVQRSMLGIMNERVWKRGRNYADCLLHTALASTNKDPELESAADSQLDAVIDRFLFQCRVEYLTDSDQRMRMYEKFLKGMVPTTEIDYEDLAYFSSVVLDANQITDPIIIQTYDAIIEEFALEHPRKISDRRKCKLLEIVEAQALLNGRFEVHPEDIYAVKYGLCYGDDKASQDRFDQIAKKHIDLAAEAMAQDVDKLQIEFIGKLNGELDDITNEVLDESSYFNQIKRLNKVRDDSDTVKPQLDSTRFLVNKLIERIDNHASVLKKFAEEVR